MRRRRGFGCVLASISCLGILHTWAPAQTVGNSGLAISGYVRDDANHQVLKAVALELVGATGTIASPPTMSGVTGEFLFNGLNSGDFRISAHMSGYEPASVEVRLGGTSLANVSVNLNRVDASAAR